MEINVVGRVKSEAVEEGLLSDDAWDDNSEDGSGGSDDDRLLLDTSTYLRRQ
jgi:hypothetical protein